jgi:hypothetical protein
VAKSGENIQLIISFFFVGATLASTTTVSSQAEVDCGLDELLHSGKDQVSLQGALGLSTSSRNRRVGNVVEAVAVVAQ